MKHFVNYKHKRILHFLIVFSLVGIVVSLYVLWQGEQIYVIAQNSYEEIRVQTWTNQSQEIDASLDFAKLKQINSDFVAWLGQQGNDINYPVVQGRDNDYYLNRLFNLERNKMGSIFMDYRNRNDFSDRNTIIYGHNMRDGSMFSTLSQYQSPNFILQQPYILLFTEQHRYRIDFFAGMVVDGSYESVRFDFSNDEDFLSYIKTLTEASSFKTSHEITEIDRIVSLVTCSYEYNNARYALYGKLVHLP
jgi:sortase B